MRIAIAASSFCASNDARPERVSLPRHATGPLRHLRIAESVSRRERLAKKQPFADSRFWPAWYNLGLTRAARGDDVGARFAFNRTLHYKPGHSQALFQEGLMAESRGDNETAIEMYAKAISINHQLLDVKTNPRVLDSKLIHLALLRAYPKEHSREAVMFQATPPTYGARSVPAAERAAPSPQAPADKIVTPAPPITNPATQTAPPNPRP